MPLSISSPVILRDARRRVAAEWVMDPGHLGEGAAGPAGQALAASMRTKLEALEGSFAALAASLQGQVQASQQQTLEHLLLYEAAADELQASAAEASAAYASLLGTCRQLGEELRGVDLLAGRVAAVRAAVDQLGEQVEAVARAAPQPLPTTAGGGGAASAGGGAAGR